MSDKLKYFIEAWEMNGVGQTVATVQDSPGTVVTITVDDLRALLARQPAAIDKEADDDIEEAREILENMVRSIELDGNYSTEATCTFLRQALNCLPVAAPLANEASKPAVRNCQTGWADFCLMAKHDGVTCPSESCDIDDGVRAAPLVEQDARGAKPVRTFTDAAMTFSPSLMAELTDSRTYARAASTSANVAQGAEAVALTEDQRQILEWCKNYHFRRCTEGDFHLRIVAVVNQILDAPPAQTALTDDARKLAAKAIVEVYLGFPAPDREPCELDLKAADAAYAALSKQDPQ